MVRDAERVTVSTYVPAYQRERWREQAEGLDMSLSEFVRSMVQAGRRGFDLDDDSGEADEPGDRDVNPRGNGLEEAVLDALDRTEAMEWDELVDELNGDFEDRLEGVLEELQSRDRILHSGRRGGYVLVEGEHGE